MRSGKLKAESGKRKDEGVSRVRVGGVVIGRGRDGSLWLMREDGEGMQMNNATEAAFARTVAGFYRRNF